MVPCGRYGGRVECTQCRRRHRNRDELERWNVEYIAGLQVGTLCPDCQTSEQHIEAEINHATVDYAATQGVQVSLDEDFVNNLVQTYRTPETLRAKADRLALLRVDPQATSMVQVMRDVADAMESGDLFADD